MLNRAAKLETGGSASAEPAGEGPMELDHVAECRELSRRFREMGGQLKYYGETLKFYSERTGDIRREHPLPNFRTLIQDIERAHQEYLRRHREDLV